MRSGVIVSYSYSKINNIFQISVIMLSTFSYQENTPKGSHSRLYFLWWLSIMYMIPSWPKKVDPGACIRCFDADDAWVSSIVISKSRNVLYFFICTRWNWTFQQHWLLHVICVTVLNVWFLEPICDPYGVCRRSNGHPVSWSLQANRWSRWAKNVYYHSDMAPK